MKLELFYPVKPHRVTQNFGEIANLAYYQAHGITFAGHNGMDISAAHGQPIYAAHGGTAYYEIDGSQGHGVVIRTNEQFDYGIGQAYFKTIYWHMVDSAKEPGYRSPIEPFISLDGPGVQVKAGDLIGYADTTGLSTGDHLHFGLKPVLPGEKAGIWFNIAQNNGYMGAIDPEPYFNGKYAQDISGRAFLKDMELGDVGHEVEELQKKLKRLGYFPADKECTGVYGQITRAAVFAFQKDHVALSFAARYVYRGKYCYSATREALNRM